MSHVRAVGADRPATVVGGFLSALTTPLALPVTELREMARTCLIFVALAITLATLWLSHPAQVHTGAVLALAAAVALTGVISMVPAAHGVLNRVGGLLVMAQIATLVALTGGVASVYRPLYIMLLLYAAVFYGLVRLLATGVVVALALLIPALAGGRAADVTAVVVEAAVWVITTATVHALVTRIRTSAQTDGLTGLRNHVTFWQLLHLEHDRCLRYGGAYAVLLIDIDHFKRVNDTLGHAAGDEVLRTVAGVLAARCRSSDVVGRYGGEEFAVILPETDRDTAVSLAKELRLRIASAPTPVPVTVSIGVASGADAFARTPEAALDAADRALYEAKRAGRNHVAVAFAGDAAA